MPKNIQNSKRGFTIIEVVLVLAIAGLIFLMVFTALPALQRSQRDTARRDDLSRFLTQITNYQTNNRGKLPGTGESVAAQAVTSYANFIINYLWANGDQFIDPDGELYTIGGLCPKFGDNTNKVGNQSCDQDAGGIADVNNSSSLANILPSSDPLVVNTFAADAATSWDGVSTPTADQLKTTDVDTALFNHAIFLYQFARCEGEKVVLGNGARNLAIQFKLEGGGIFCGQV